MTHTVAASKFHGVRSDIPSTVTCDCGWHFSKLADRLNVVDAHEEHREAFRLHRASVGLSSQNAKTGGERPKWSFKAGRAA